MACVKEGQCELSQLSSDFLGLYASKADADVTFVFPGGEIKAHKLVLATRVPHFKTILSAATNRIEIPDANMQCFDVFLSFVYGGRLPVEGFDVESQLIFAKKYDFPTLIPHCIPKIKLDMAEIKDLDVCISEAGRMMDAHPFPEVRNLLETILQTRINDEVARIPQRDSTCPRCRNYYCGGSCFSERLKSDFIGQIVKLLVLSHLNSCQTLKATCMRHFRAFDCRGRNWSDTLIAEAAKDLTNYPDLLIEMLGQYCRD